MKFLADMGISQSTVRWLRENGYDAVHLREENLHKISDAEIIEKGRRENRIILTCDLHFSYIMSVSKSVCPKDKKYILYIEYRRLLLDHDLSN